MANGLLGASSGTKQAPTAPVYQLLMLTRRKAASATVTKSYSLVFYTWGAWENSSRCSDGTNWVGIACENLKQMRNVLAYL